MSLPYRRLTGPRSIEVIIDDNEFWMIFLCKLKSCAAILEKVSSMETVFLLNIVVILASMLDRFMAWFSVDAFTINLWLNSSLPSLMKRNVFSSAVAYTVWPHKVMGESSIVAKR
jgi:hypothetical protein